MTRYSRQDVLRILRLAPRQLHRWERAGLIPPKSDYGFSDLTQLRVLAELCGQRMKPASIRNSVQAMQAVAGLANPLVESTVVPVGARLAFRHSGVMVDPIRRQLFLDFEAGPTRRPLTLAVMPTLRNAATRDRALQAIFVEAVQAEEQGKKTQAMELYNSILQQEPKYTAALINLGTLNYHLKRYPQAEDFYRRATLADPEYVLAFFDLGNVLDELGRPDESILAYQRALALSPSYADAHYNLALAYERKGERRRALTHWQAYVRLDREGAWSEHARSQIRKLLSREKLSIAHRTTAYLPNPGRQASRLSLVAAFA